MKRINLYLNGMKSRCFVLFACLALMVSLTSCSEDYFEDNLPEKSKELSKAELIEKARSLKPKTRAIPPFPVVMATSKSTVSIICRATESVRIHWGDEEETLIPAMAGDYPKYSHTYSDNSLHIIYLETSNEAIQLLGVEFNGLELLDVTGNTNLSTLECRGNYLDELNLTGCPKLKNLYVNSNKLSAMDFTQLPHLCDLMMDNNLFTDVDFSKNLELTSLIIGYNSIADLDLRNNIELKNIIMDGLPIRTINNIPINAKSFATFPKLEELSISDTPFASLDLSYNSLVNDLRIANTAITQLDISNLQIRVFVAGGSKLTNLKFTPSNFAPEVHLVDILETPFQEVKSNVQSLILALPSRVGMSQGLLCTTSQYLEPWRLFLDSKNWRVFP